MGYIVIFVSAVIFYILSIIIQYIPIFSVANNSKWKNIFVSFIHSCITSCWAILSLLERPELLDDLISEYTSLSYSLIAFSTGYFIYDLQDIFFKSKSQQSLAIVTHHFVVIICFVVAVCTQSFISLALVSLLAEINSIFLHLRQLLLLYEVSKWNMWYRLNSLVNLATFIVFRLFLLVWIGKWLLINREVMPVNIYILTSVSLVAMVAINIGLFYRLLQSDYLKVHSRN